MTNPVSVHAMEHIQYFDNAFSLKNIHHDQNNCRTLKFTNLEIPAKKTKNDLSMQVSVVAASKIKEISMPPCLQQ